MDAFEPGSSGFESERSATTTTPISSFVFLPIYLCNLFSLFYVSFSLNLGYPSCFALVCHLPLAIFASIRFNYNYLQCSRSFTRFDEENLGLVHSSLINITK